MPAVLAAVGGSPGGHSPIVRVRVAGLLMPLAKRISRATPPSWPRSAHVQLSSSVGIKGRGEGLDGGPCCPTPLPPSLQVSPPSHPAFSPTRPPTGLVPCHSSAAQAHLALLARPLQAPVAVDCHTTKAGGTLLGAEASVGAGGKRVGGVCLHLIVVFPIWKYSWGVPAGRQVWRKRERKLGEWRAGESRWDTAATNSLHRLVARVKDAAQSRTCTRHRASSAAQSGPSRMLTRIRSGG